MSVIHKSSISFKMFIIKWFKGFTTYGGKFSFVKSSLFLILVLFLICQPWYIIRTALASSFMGYLFSTLTANTIDTLVDTGL